MVRLQRASALYFILVLVTCAFLQAQQTKKQIIEYVRMISMGHEDQVTSKLPQLRTNFQNNPSFSYVEGLLATDGVTAIQCFRFVADSFPSNEWADDALVRLAEIYGASGKRQPMEESIDRLHSRYPQSPYILTNYASHITEGSGEAASSDAANQSGAEYAIQVGAFSVRSNAEKLQQRLSVDGYRVDIFENFLDGKNLLYLVWIGSFKTMRDAQEGLSTIQSKTGIKGILRTRSSWKRW